MIEFSESNLKDFSIDENQKIKIIGVGGAGTNIIDRMALEGGDDADLIIVNTDVRSLSTSVSGSKIQLGSTLLRGIGTGGDPGLGKQAALEAIDEIRECIKGNSMVFICVGLGGGTGSGAVVEVARVAREENAFIVVLATIPFSFEGERRMSQANEALDQINAYANIVVTFDNDRMGELIVPRDGVSQAFIAADKVISQCIRSTMNIVFRPGIIRIGMDDFIAALQGGGARCLFGFGIAKGDGRSIVAVEEALKCPLLDQGKLLSKAKKVLVQVIGGDSLTLYEVQLVMEEVSKHISKDTMVIFGTGVDKRFTNSLSVTILSSISDPKVDTNKVESNQVSSSSYIIEGRKKPEVINKPEKVKSNIEKDIFEIIEDNQDNKITQLIKNQEIEDEEEDQRPSYISHLIPSIRSNDKEDLSDEDNNLDVVESSIEKSPTKISLSKSLKEKEGFDDKKEEGGVNDKASSKKDVLKEKNKDDFFKSDPTAIDGIDLDVPAFLRRKEKDSDNKI